MSENDLALLGERRVVAQRRAKTSADSIKVGDQFGMLTVIGNAVPGRGQIWFPCQCECGQPVFRPTRILAGPTRQSCGCSRGNVRHHSSKKDPLYGVWSNMRSRCLSPTNPAYANYGGRGIAITPEWDDFTVFRAWAISGYREGLTLDRADNNGPYSPDNCRWTTPAVQNRNRRSAVLIEHEGETKSLVEWSEDPRCAVAYHTLYQRVRAGRPFGDALVTPVNGKGVMPK